jgi:hypothetical protein
MWCMDKHNIMWRIIQYDASMKNYDLNSALYTILGCSHPPIILKEYAILCMHKYHQSPRFLKPNSTLWPLYILKFFDM